MPDVVKLRHKAGCGFICFRSLVAIQRAMRKCSISSNKNRGTPIEDHFYEFVVYWVGFALTLFSLLSVPILAVLFTSIS